MDLSTRPISAAELDNCARALGGITIMLDRTSSQWQTRGLEHMVIDIRTELLADSKLLQTPIIRQGKIACIGLDESAWIKMANAEKA